ncbi:MAG: hypothetical protein JZU65_10650, partial [Chlorobium sp.]|nr:hypothetical protein [Chlorobium sp.]
MFSIDITIILAQRFWQAASGLVTILLIAHLLTPVQQGWYYSFLSLASLYTLFDLGLSVVLVQISAHQFVGMKWLPGGGAEGESLLRFYALVGRSSRLYLLLALIFFLLVLPTGVLIFGVKSGLASVSDGPWMAPWVMLIAATALSILILPYLAMVEGSGQVKEVYQVRLAQGVLGSMACWIVLVTGGGLWATVMVPTMGLVVALLWLSKIRPELFYAGLRNPGKELAWRREVWPLQWRLGLSWMCGYLLTQIYTPILFSTQGAIVAGQMGLSLTIANMLGLLCQSWIARRVPAMAQAVGRRDWEGFDRLFKLDFMLSVIVFICGSFVLCAIHLLLQATPYSVRVLPFGPFAGLLGVTLMSHVNGALAAQLRSFQREPFVWISVVAAILTVPGALWMAGLHGVGGVVLVMLAVQILFIFPFSLILWQKCNRA